jgi:hypothetical protein
VLDAEVRVEVGAIVSLTIPECLSGDFATALESEVLPVIGVIGNCWKKLTQRPSVLILVLGAAAWKVAA